MRVNILLPLSWLYALGLILRRILRSTGIAKTYRPPVRTISVGNITAGGTGKSPLVEFLCTELKKQSLSVVVARRNRAAWPSNADLTDEAKVFSENVPETPQVLGRSKEDCVRRACASRPDIVLVDDGFQTLFLERDLDIITIDATSPFGNGFLLPAGTLREPPYELRRADAVVLTHCLEIMPEAKDALVRKLRRWTSSEIFEARYVVDNVATLSGDSADPSTMAGKKIFAFCGIGSPAGFVRTLERLNCVVAGKSIFSDHHVYCSDDLSTIKKDAEKCGAEMIVTTQKDAVRLRSLEGLEWEIHYLKIHLGVRNADKLCRLVVGE